MKKISKIREFFWPLLEKTIIPDPKQISSEEVTVSNKHLEKTLEYAIKCYESENERKKTVESKSSLFIGTISVITSVIIGVTTVLIKSNEDYSMAISILLLLLFILTVYMARTVWFSIKALERKSYYTLSVSDFFIIDNDDLYFKKLIAEITNKLRKNSITINSKVDNMVMAQEYFKRAIIIVVVYAFIISLIFLPKTNIDLPQFYNNAINLLNSIRLSVWNIVILYTLVVISLIVSIIAYLRKK